jgi:hypothetical protein
MPAFVTFALLYMTAVYLELSEKWTYPSYTAAVLALIVVLALTRITRLTFLGFLAVTTAQWALVQLPDVANHVNLMVYANVAMMIGIAYSSARPRAVGSDDAWYAMMRPVLQVTLILVYFLAGFHKLNRDFVNPAVSCVTGTIDSLWAAARSSLAGVPTFVVLGAGVAVVGALLLRSSPWRRYMPQAAVAAVAVALLAVGLLLLPGGGVRSAAYHALVPLMIALIILWEVVGGPLLAVPRLQLPVVAFSWSMHASLALVNFVDFGGLALALLYNFVPPAYQAVLAERVRLPGIARPVARIHLYVAIAVVAGAINGRARLGAGILFNIAALVFLWPLLRAWAGGVPRPRWEGVPLTARRTPAWMLALPALLVAYASTAYLGLRTAGNFSMFSNIRTEGERSNHFLLASNPLKVWGYQEDVVRVLQIDDRAARIGYQYQPLQDRLLPVVEFRKLVYLWTQAGRTVPMTLEYRGVVHTTPDIARDPAWHTPRRTAAMRLMKFRSIQAETEGPNRCRW